MLRLCFQVKIFSNGRFQNIYNGYQFLRQHMHITTECKKENKYISTKMLTTKSAITNINSSMSSNASKKQSEVLDYLNSKESLRDIIPFLPTRYITKRIQSPDTQFLIDRDFAVKIVETIKHDLLSGDSYVFEINPGPGVITNELLKINIQNLRLFEDDLPFVPNLNALAILYKRKLEITHFNFLHASTVTYQDRCDDAGRLDKLMEGVKRRTWEDIPVVKIIGAVPSTPKNDFVRYLMYSIIFQDGLVTYGRPELYGIIHPFWYLRLTTNPEDGFFMYRARAVLFNLFFESTVILKIPYQSVIPWCAKQPKKRGGKLNKIRDIDTDYLYFIKVTPHADLYSRIRPELLKPLWFFLRHHMLKRKSKVIPKLEHWVPGCGPRLIAKGITIHTQFGELTPLEILDIFHEFVSWPEFNSCPFLPSMETALLKMQQSDNDDLLDEDADVEDVEENDKVEITQAKQSVK